MKKYWIELLVLAIIITSLLICVSTSITWMNTNSDGAHYILAAKYITTSHHLSAPLYLLLGHLFLKIPIGTDALRMGLISVLATIGTCIFIYLIIRHLLREDKKARLYAVISTLVYGGSALVVSQSSIIETYPLIAMCGVGAYYFVLKQKWVWASIILGIGLAIHPLIVFVWIVLLVAFKEMRNWRYWAITLSFGLFYLYIPIVGHLNPNDNMWGNTSVEGLIGGTYGTIMMHTGGLSIWDMPKRIIDTLLILTVCFGLGIIPLIWHFIKTKKIWYHLLWLFLIPVLYFIGDLAAQVYVYMILGIAFGSIAVGLGLSRMRKEWAIAVLIVALLLGGYNTYYYDVDGHLDPEMSAMKFYNEELTKIPDGHYFMAGGWTWAMTYLYNKEENRNIIPISVDALPDDNYLEELELQGIKVGSSDSESYITKQGELELSIVELNENVWIPKEVKPEVYQYEVVPAKGNEDYIGRWIGQEIEPGNWQWRPSNPWKYISGELEVKEWHHILISDKSAFLVCAITVFVACGLWFVVYSIKRYRREKQEELEEYGRNSEL